MVSKTRLSILPDIGNLRKLSQSLAMLDAILSPEWEYRYYSFDSKWGKNEMMASMRDGSGDEYFILFNTQGAIIKGFAHESPMSPCVTVPIKVWPGVLCEVPERFGGFLSEPAFSIQNTTFCIWRGNQDQYWQTGSIEYPESEDADGSEELLARLDGAPSSYVEFAKFYYERETPLSLVERIYQHERLTEELVDTLNPQISFADLQTDIEEIGYPYRLM